MSKPTYDFMDQLIDQLYSGGLFAKVLQNVPTNIFNKQASSKNKDLWMVWYGSGNGNVKDNTVVNSECF